MKCWRCRGTGRTGSDIAEFMERGRALRAARLAAGLGLTDAAAAIGTTPAALSDAELGRVDPADATRAVLGAGWAAK